MKSSKLKQLQSVILGMNTFFIAVLLLVAESLSQQGYLVSVPETPTQIKQITVVLDDNYPPFVFRNKDDKIQGILVDQWALWEKKTGIRVHLIAMNWEDAKQTMAAGKADVIDTIFFTPERSKVYDFTKAYAVIDVPIFFNSNLSGITDASSIRDFTVGVKKGDAAIDELKQYGVKNFVYYDNYEAIIKAAKADKIVVFCVDKPPALYFSYKEGILDKFKMTKPLYTGEFHRAVHKGNAELLSVIEKGFAAFTKAEYNTIDQKWYGTSLQYQDYFKVIFIGFFSISAVVLFLGIWNLTLNKRVKQKAAALEKELLANRDMETALHSSENQYKSLIETTLEGYCLMTTEGVIQDVNPALCDMLCVERNQLIGESMHRFIEVSDQDSFNSLLKSIPSIHHKVLELRMVSKSQTPRIALFNTTVLIREPGQVSGMFALISDITQRRLAEDALQSAYSNLETLVQQRTQELSLANQQLMQMNQQMIVAFEDLKLTQDKLIQSEKVASLGLLVAGIAHEINTPVGNCITLATYLNNASRDIKKDMPETDDIVKTWSDYVKQYEDATQLLINNLNRVSELVGHFKQISIDQSVEHRYLFQMREHLEDLIFSLRAMFKDSIHNIDLACDNSIVCYNYPDALNKALLQLVSNSVIHGFKYTKQGDIQISVTEEETYLVIEYSDNGAGIPPEDLPKIFDPFYTSSRASGNIGLGLSVVHNIITQRLGGNISCDSTLNEGTRFRITLKK